LGTLGRRTCTGGSGGDAVTLETAMNRILKTIPDCDVAEANDL
jgi:hypothetical protein